MLKALKEDINSVAKFISTTIVLRASKIVINRVDRDSIRRESELTQITFYMRYT